MEMVVSAIAFNCANLVDYLIGGIPKSWQIFLASRSLISLCLGTDEL